MATPITGIRTSEGVSKIDFSALVNVPQMMTQQYVQQLIQIAIQEAIKDIPAGYEYGTTDLTAGTSTLATGKVYFVYE